VELLAANGDGRPRNPRALSAEAEERLFEAELAVEEAAAVNGAPSVLDAVQEMLAEEDAAQQEALIQEIASKIPGGTESVADFRREQQVREARLRNLPPSRVLSAEEEERLFATGLEQDELAARGGVSEFQRQKLEEQLFDAALEEDERAFGGGVSEFERLQLEEQSDAALNSAQVGPHSFITPEALADEFALLQLREQQRSQADPDYQPIPDRGLWRIAKQNLSAPGTRGIERLPGREALDEFDPGAEFKFIDPAGVLPQAGLNIALGGLDLLSVPQAGVIGAINNTFESLESLDPTDPRTLLARSSPVLAYRAAQGGLEGLRDPASARPETLPILRDLPEGPGTTVAAFLVGVALDPLSYLGVGLFDDGLRLLTKLDEAVEVALGLGRRDLGPLDETLGRVTDDVQSPKPGGSTIGPVGQIERPPLPPGVFQAAKGVFAVRSELVAGTTDEIGAALAGVARETDDAIRQVESVLGPDALDAIRILRRQQADLLASGGVLIDGVPPSADLGPASSQALAAMRGAADPDSIRTAGEQAVLPFFLKLARLPVGASEAAVRAAIQHARAQSAALVDVLEKKALLRASTAVVREVARGLTIEVARAVLEAGQEPVFR